MGNLREKKDENEEIIGSVRAYFEKGNVYIGKLMVLPTFGAVFGRC